MRRLIQELTMFFAGGDVDIAPAISAQTYEPLGVTAYTPQTDNRLVRMVHGARAFGRSDWARVKRAIDHMLDAPGGHGHLQTLRLACSDPGAGWPEVACRTPTAMLAARVECMRHEHMALVEAAYTLAVERGDSGMTAAMRALEEDRRLFVSGIRIPDAQVQITASRLVRHGKVNLDAVQRETDAAIDGAAAAYRAAREAVGASKREDRAKRQRASSELLDTLMAKKAAKERKRYEARLQGSS